MSWQDFLSEDEERVLPWTGGRTVHGRDRTWVIQGRLPAEYGWYTFETGGSRKAKLVGPAEPAHEFYDSFPLLRGYLAGDRFIPDTARIDPDPIKCFEQTKPVFLVERGLERFTRVTVARHRGDLIYFTQEWAGEAEQAVQAAYEDRLDSIAHVPDVSPALDLAFRWETYQRELAKVRAEKVRAELARQRELDRQAEIRERALKDAGTALGRRHLATYDFEAAARAALTVSGSELLDCRESYENSNEMVVKYRFRGRRLECVVDRATLRIITAGVCLTDEDTGVMGDTLFTLESLPGVVGEGIDTGALHIYRGHR